MKELTLKDMTKEELLWLIKRCSIGFISEREIYLARWVTLIAKEARVLDQAIAVTKGLSGAAWLSAFRKSQVLNKKADKLSKLADRYYERMSAL